MLTLYDILLIT